MLEWIGMLAPVGGHVFGDRALSTSLITYGRHPDLPQSTVAAQFTTPVTLMAVSVSWALTSTRVYMFDGCPQNKTPTHRGATSEPFILWRPYPDPSQPTP